MSVHEKKQQRIYDLLNVDTKPKILFPAKQEEIFIEKELFKEREKLRIEQKMETRLFNCSRYGD